MPKPIKTKRCNRCKKIKDFSEFHKSVDVKDGMQRMCKICNKEYQKVYKRTYRKTDKYKTSAYEYRHSPQGLLASREVYKRNRIKKLSSACVRYKVKIGKMIHPKLLKCISCINQAQEYHHHNGYDKKHCYDVVPVCIVCHNKVHNPIT